MFDFGFSELVVVFVVALVVLGPTRLPGLVRKVGRWIGKARAMALPLNPADWTGAAPPAKLAFACTASGVAAKCAPAGRCGAGRSTRPCAGSRSKG